MINQINISKAEAAQTHRIVTNNNCQFIDGQLVILSSTCRLFVKGSKEAFKTINSTSMNREALSKAVKAVINWN